MLRETMVMLKLFIHFQVNNMSLYVTFCNYKL